MCIILVWLLIWTQIPFTYLVQNNLFLHFLVFEEHYFPIKILKIYRLRRSASYLLTTLDSSLGGCLKNDAPRAFQGLRYISNTSSAARARAGAHRRLWVLYFFGILTSWQVISACKMALSYIIRYTLIIHNTWF